MDESQSSYLDKIIKILAPGSVAAGESVGDGQIELHSLVTAPLGFRLRGVGIPCCGQQIDCLLLSLGRFITGIG
ncbi:hypothetical protein GCM10011575_00200 [Microlunatus endophyticus]|uniref:Uncharacterized protein n=1 Tax=Microlunatus endophyticus TaxID=1716077 RepID=A0A917VYS9_9ACTN|nr:hypothetical protein GCM10011575_00200 [Microlunatus endophyticus]